MKMLCEFSGQPSQSDGKRKRYCSDMPNVVSAIDGTSHEIQIPSNEPKKKHTFSKPILFIEWYEKKFYKQW